MTSNIAEKACKYARTQIIAGSTLIENNLFEESKKLALIKAVKDIRELTQNSDYILDIDKTILHFQNSVSNASKYSIGNCGEYAFMALFYIISHNPDTFAEVYHIEGGDHAFLVIGRDPNSNPNVPSTWGETAYICDPWANKTYLAKNFESELKNFYLTYTVEEGFKNNSEDFDPSKHRLCPSGNYNSKYLQQTGQSTSSILFDVYNLLNDKYLIIYKEFLENLKKIAEQIKNKYGEEDVKYRVLVEKINSIQSIIVDFESVNKNHLENIKMNTLFINDATVLQKNLQDKINKFRKEASSTPEVLHSYRKEDSLITMIKKYLGIQPTSAEKYRKAIFSSKEELDSLEELTESSFKKKLF